MKRDDTIDEEFFVESRKVRDCMNTRLTIAYSRPVYRMSKGIATTIDPFTKRGNWIRTLARQLYRLRSISFKT